MAWLNLMRMEGRTTDGAYGKERGKKEEEKEERGGRGGEGEEKMIVTPGNSLASSFGKQQYHFATSPVAHMVALGVLLVHWQ